MFKIKKWNYDTRQYEPYEVPADWYVPLYCSKMDTKINCVSCGKAITFGDCYTSKVFHNSVGLGYGVCEECHEKEWKEYCERRKKL